MLLSQTSTSNMSNTGWLFNEVELKRREEVQWKAKLLQQQDLKLFLQTQALKNPRKSNATLLSSQLDQNHPPHPFKEEPPFFNLASPPPITSSSPTLTKTYSHLKEKATTTLVPTTATPLSTHAMQFSNFKPTQSFLLPTSSSSSSSSTSHPLNVTSNPSSVNATTSPVTDSTIPFPALPSFVRAASAARSTSKLPSSRQVHPPSFASFTLSSDAPPMDSRLSKVNPEQQQQQQQQQHNYSRNIASPTKTRHTNEGHPYQVHLEKVPPKENTNLITHATSISSSHYPYGTAPSLASNLPSNQVTHPYPPTMTTPSAALHPSSISVPPYMTYYAPSMLTSIPTPMTSMSLPSLTHPMSMALPPPPLPPPPTTTFPIGYPHAYPPYGYPYPPPPSSSYSHPSLVPSNGWPSSLPPVHTSSFDPSHSSYPPPPPPLAPPHLSFPSSTTTPSSSSSAAANTLGIGARPLPPPPPPALSSTNVTETKRKEYQHALEQQILEKKQRDELVKQSLAQEELKKLQEMKTYQPFGKGGAGAPLMAPDGSVITTRSKKPMVTTSLETSTSPTLSSNTITPATTTVSLNPRIHTSTTASVTGAPSSTSHASNPHGPTPSLPLQPPAATTISEVSTMDDWDTYQKLQKQKREKALQQCLQQQIQFKEQQRQEAVFKQKLMEAKELEKLQFEQRMQHQMPSQDLDTSPVTTTHVTFGSSSGPAVPMMSSNEPNPTSGSLLSSNPNDMLLSPTFSDPTKVHNKKYPPKLSKSIEEAIAAEEVLRKKAEEEALKRKHKLRRPTTTTPVTKTSGQDEDKKSERNALEQVEQKKIYVPPPRPPPPPSPPIPTLRGKPPPPMDPYPSTSNTSSTSPYSTTHEAPLTTTTTTSVEPRPRTTPSHSLVSPAPTSTSSFSSNPNLSKPSTAEVLERLNTLKKVLEAEQQKVAVDLQHQTHATGMVSSTSVSSTPKKSPVGPSMPPPQTAPAPPAWFQSSSTMVPESSTFLKFNAHDIASPYYPIPSSTLPRPSSAASTIHLEVLERVNAARMRKLQIT